MKRPKKLGLRPDAHLVNPVTLETKQRRGRTELKRQRRLEEFKGFPSGGECADPTMTNSRYTLQQFSTVGLYDCCVLGFAGAYACSWAKWFTDSPRLSPFMH